MMPQVFSISILKRGDTNAEMIRIINKMMFIQNAINVKPNPIFSIPKGLSKYRYTANNNVPIIKLDAAVIFPIKIKFFIVVTICVRDGTVCLSSFCDKRLWITPKLKYKKASSESATL